MKSTKNACRECYKVASEGWRTLSWDQLMLKAQVDEQVRDEIASALKVRRTGRAPWMRQDVGSCLSQAYEVMSEYVILTEQQYRDKFGITPAAAGVRIDEVQDEHGHILRGVVLVDPKQPFKKLRLLSRFEFQMSEELHRSQEQLRSTQGREMFTHYTGEHAKDGPGFLRAPPMTFDAMELLAAEKLQQAGAEATAAAAAAAAAAAGQMEATEDAHNPSTSILNPNSEEEPDEDEEALAPLMPSTLAQREDTKKRRKGGKASGKGKAKQMPRKHARHEFPPATPAALQPMPKQLAAPALTQTTAPARSRSPRVKEEQHSNPDSVGARSVSKSLRSPPDEHKVSACIKSLDLSTIVSGVARGNEMYQARRVRDCLLKTDPHSLDLVLLQTHLDKCITAQKLVSTKIGSLTAMERKKALEALQPEAISWPIDVQTALVSIKLKEEVGNGCPASEEEVKAKAAMFLDLLSPWMEDSSQERPAFNVQKPQWAAVVIDDEVANARVFTRLMVNEFLIPLVMQGERQRRCLHSYLLGFRKMLRGLGGAAPLFQAAVKAVTTCFDAAWVLLEPSQSSEYIAKLDIVCEAREGTESHLRQALSQSLMYKALMQELRAHELASAQFGPRVQAATDALRAATEKKEVSMEMLRTQVPDLVSWRTALRAGSTKHLEAVMVKAFLELESTSSDAREMDDLALLAATASQNPVEEDLPA